MVNLEGSCHVVKHGIRPPLRDTTLSTLRLPRTALTPCALADVERRSSGPSGGAAARRPPRPERRDRRRVATVRPVVGLDQLELDARLDRKAEHDALSRRDRE